MVSNPAIATRIIPRDSFEPIVAIHRKKPIKNSIPAKIGFHIRSSKVIALLVHL